MKIKGIKWLKFSREKEKEEKENKVYQDTETEPHPIATMSKYLDFTPFGDFHKDSPLNPYKLYNEFYWGIFIGFSTNSPEFTYKRNNKWEFTLDKIEGLAIWRVIDQHRIIAAPSLFYDWNVVKNNIESSLVNSNDENDELIMDGLSIAEGLGDEHVVLILPTGDITYREEADENYSEFKKDALELFKSRPDSFLIIDGSPIERL